MGGCRNSPNQVPGAEVQIWCGECAGLLRRSVREEPRTFFSGSIDREQMFGGQFFGGRSDQICSPRHRTCDVGFTIL